MAGTKSIHAESCLNARLPSHEQTVLGSVEHHVIKLWWETADMIAVIGVDSRHHGVRYYAMSSYQNT